MKNHVNLSSEDSKQLCKDTKSIKDETSMEKPRDLHSDGLDQSSLLGDEIDEKELEKALVYHDNKYTKKHILGAKLAKLIKKNGIHPDSLIPEHKALDLHVKQWRKCIDCIFNHD